MCDITANRVLIIVGAECAPAAKTIVLVGDLSEEFKKAGWLAEKNPFGTWILRKTPHEERTKTVILRFPTSAFSRELQKDYDLEGELYWTTDYDVRTLLEDLPERLYGDGKVYHPKGGTR